MFVHLSLRENHLLEISGNPYEKSEISYALARNPFEKLEISNAKYGSDLPLVKEDCNLIDEFEINFDPFALGGQWVIWLKKLCGDGRR